MGPGVKIVLTGPTGWIGTAFLAALSTAYGPGWPHDVTLFGSSERRLRAPDGAELRVRPLESVTGEDIRGALVVHLAYLTKDKLIPLSSSEFFRVNTAIDDALLVALQAETPRAVFVASSGAAGQAQSGCGRDLYGLCKLMQEDRFLEFGARAGVPVFVGRIFNLAGPYINKLSSYAVSNFLQQAFAERCVRVTARVPVYRSYLHVIDLCDLVLGALAIGHAPGAVMDICGAEVLEMQDVARRALAAADADEGRIERDIIDYDHPSLYLGDPTPARTLALKLGLEPKSFVCQVADTAADLCARGLAG